MKNYGIEDFAKYPYIPPAQQYFKEHPITITDLADSKWTPFIARAEERIIESFSKDHISCKIDNPEIEFVSFHIASVLVKSTKLEHIAMRWGFAEAERSRQQLLLEKDSEKVLDIAKMLLGIKIEQA